jgi:hypothetical protein
MTWCNRSKRYSGIIITLDVIDESIFNGCVVISEDRIVSFVVNQIVIMFMPCNSRMINLVTNSIFIVWTRSNIVFVCLRYNHMSHKWYDHDFKRFG